MDQLNDYGDDTSSPTPKWVIVVYIITLVLVLTLVSL